MRLFACIHRSLLSGVARKNSEFSEVKYSANGSCRFHFSRSFLRRAPSTGTQLEAPVAFLPSSHESRLQQNPSGYLLLGFSSSVRRCRLVPSFVRPRNTFEPFRLLSLDSFFAVLSLSRGLYFSSLPLFLPLFTRRFINFAQPPRTQMEKLSGTRRECLQCCGVRPTNLL